MSKILRKILCKIARMVQRCRIIYYQWVSSSEVRITGKPICIQPLYITGQGECSFIGSVRIGCVPSPDYFNTYAHFDLRGTGARIEIADGVWINNHSTLVADGAQIRIGAKTLIGGNVSIFTSNFHGLAPDQRLSTDYPRENVVVQENVFIGSNVTLLKGITIGCNSVIGTGSIVVSDIPANVIAAGVPCKVIKLL